jgi:hypothetical protein
MYASRWFIPRLTLAAALISVMAAAAEPALDGDEATRADDDRRAAAVLAALGEQAGEFKAVSSWSKVIAGGALTTAGVLVDSRYDASYGPALWISGVAVMANGLASLFVRPPIESFANEIALMKMGPSPAGLEALWRARAAEAKSRRKTVGIIDLGVGVAGAGAATILAAGVGDLSREDRSRWVALTIVVSGYGFADGLYRLLVASDIEDGYALAYPTTSASPRTVAVGVAPLRRGAALQLQANF